VSRYQLQIELFSDTTFGRGDGVAGFIDQEIEHDRYGLPYLRGRTLKGLLSEECDNLIACLPESNQQHWSRVAGQLFGKAGSGLETIAKVHFGDACLPLELQTVIAYHIKFKHFTPVEMLESLTTIRRQTAINTKTGVADEGSLRSLRVALRELSFTANLLIDSDSFTPEMGIEELLTLITVSAAALRYVGSGRNRGRGHVRCTLMNEIGKPLSKGREHYFDNFFNPKTVSLSAAEVS
jgi:hypothetical protein